MQIHYTSLTKVYLSLIELKASHRFALWSDCFAGCLISHFDSVANVYSKLVLYIKYVLIYIVSYERLS